ncbi:MAG: DUF5686 family protein [Ignavibacteriales bacterium]|nr:DUF5686 family protein [Ignavibacteriales bacterium]
MIRIFLLTLLIVSSLFSQSLKVTGIVFNEESNEPIPFTSIRIAGTTQGTSTNVEGKFVLIPPKGKSKLIFTVVGFKKKVLEIDATVSKELKVSLKPEPIQFMEIVVGSDEDPAYRIVREAIKRKDQNRAGLNSIEYDFFSKDIFLSAGNVAMVSERFSTGYFRPDKKEKVITHSVHISENEKKNALSFDQNILDKMYVDFADDTLSIIGNKVFLPLAKNAFDWYDYKLLEVKQSGSVHECYIEVIPKSKIQPLLKGKIVIEDSTYSLKNVDLKNNDGLRFPYVQDLKIEFIQNRDRFNNYWLPTYFKVESGLKFSFAGLIGTDAISMNQVSMFTNYKINPTIPDSIYNLYSTIKDDSSKNKKNKYVKTDMLSRTQIDSLRPIPLTGDELKAYNELDSTKTVVTQIKFTGVFGGLVKDAVNKDQNSSSDSGLLKYVGKVFSVLSFRDNRVDGILLGGHYGNDMFDNSIKYKVNLGYAFGRKNFEWNTNVSYSPKNFIIDNIELELFDEAVQWQMLNPYPDWLNGANVLLGFNDQFNYYRSRSFSLGFGKYFGANILSNIKFVFDKQESLPELKYNSLFNTNRIVRVNPIIAEGNDNRISFNIRIGKNPNEYQPIASDGFIAQLDVSNPILGSDFNYKRLRFISQITTKTLYEELFSSPYFLLGMEGGFVLGDFWPQHRFTPNTALNIYSPFLSFKGLSPYEYYGDKMIAIHAEHNWRSVPYQALGLNFLTDLNIDFITGINLLKMWTINSYFSSNNLNSVYWEAYLSFGKILGVLRLDFSYGSNDKFVIRVGLSNVL